MSETVKVEPVEQNPRPVGTLAEAMAENLDPAAYATCSRPNKVTGNIGCPWFDKCRVSAKGESGPRNYGVEIMKGRVQGGGFVRFKTDCMWIADHAEGYEKNGGVVKVIANEGEEFERISGIMVRNDTGDPTFDKDPMGHREVRRVKEKVPPYPRPGQNQALLVDMLRAEAIEAEKERRHDENVAVRYGLENAVTPLDKRSSGPDEGRKASGGGKPAGK